MADNPFKATDNGMEAVRAALNTGKEPAKGGSPSPELAAHTAANRANAATLATFKRGFADHLTEHATALLAVAHRLRNNAEVSIEGEFQGIELGLQDFAAHFAKFKKVLIG